MNSFVLLEIGLVFNQSTPSHQPDVVSRFIKHVRRLIDQLLILKHFCKPVHFWRRQLHHHQIPITTTKWYSKLLLLCASFINIVIL